MQDFTPPSRMAQAAQQRLQQQAVAAASGSNGTPADTVVLQQLVAALNQLAYHNVGGA